jgi:hypothetical protein
MIILDTNILSEFMSSSPNTAVIEWLDRQIYSEVWLCAPVIAEISYGLEAADEGRKLQAKRRRFETFLARGFADRIFPFTTQAAMAYGQVCHTRSQLGRPIGAFDAMIAAIARTQGATIATRNIKDFELLDLDLLNPF